MEEDNETEQNRLKLRDQSVKEFLACLYKLFTAFIVDKMKDFLGILPSTVRYATATSTLSDPQLALEECLNKIRKAGLYHPSLILGCTTHNIFHPTGLFSQLPAPFFAYQKKNVNPFVSVTYIQLPRKMLFKPFVIERKQAIPDIGKLTNVGIIPNKDNESHLLLFYNLYTQSINNLFKITNLYKYSSILSFLPSTNEFHTSTATYPDTAGFICSGSNKYTPYLYNAIKSWLNTTNNIELRYNKNADTNLFENFHNDNIINKSELVPPIITTISPDNKRIHNLPVLVKEMNYLPYRKYNLECNDFYEQYILHTCNRRRHPIGILPIANTQPINTRKVENNNNSNNNNNNNNNNVMNKNRNNKIHPKVGSYAILALTRYQNPIPNNLYSKPPSYTIDTSKRVKITKIKKSDNNNNNIVYCDADVIEDFPLNKEDETKMEYLIKELLLLGIVFEYPFVSLPKSYEGKSFSFANMLSGASLSSNSLLKNVLSTQNTLERMNMIYNTLNKGIFPERYTY